MAHDHRAVIAANNNADLYEALFTAWGLRYERGPFAFVSKDRPPPYYSHLTVLAPDCTEQVIPHLRAMAHRFAEAISFKDSFCEFLRRDRGFNLLFEASWLWRAPESASVPKGWVTVEDPLELAAWEMAWKSGGTPTNARMFRARMLRSPDVFFLGKKEAGVFVSGCIANRSSGCIGISNVFPVDDDKGAFEEAAAAVASTDPSLPIVGYAVRPPLGAPPLGFERTGQLRVLEVREIAF